MGHLIHLYAVGTVLIQNLQMQKDETAHFLRYYLSSASGYALEDLACMQESVCAHLRTASTCQESPCLTPAHTLVVASQAVTAF